jgi:hypothetical protein
VPTNKNGAVGTWCLISGTHLVLTLSYEFLEITEKKAINNHCVYYTQQKKNVRKTKTTADNAHKSSN